MNKSDMLEQIAMLPRRFHSQGDVSIFSLVKASGYFGSHDEVSEADIRAALALCPECLREWMQYSEDKRTSSGWHVIDTDEGCYEVGYITERADRQQRVVYNKLTDACAAFVKHELEIFDSVNLPRGSLLASSDTSVEGSVFNQARNSTVADKDRADLGITALGRRRHFEIENTDAPTLFAIVSAAVA